MYLNIKYKDGDTETWCLSNVLTIWYSQKQKSITIIEQAVNPREYENDDNPQTTIKAKDVAEIGSPDFLNITAVQNFKQDVLNARNS